MKGCVFRQAQVAAQRFQLLRHGAAEGADALAQFVGPPGEIAAPEGHPGDRAGRFGHGDAVVVDVQHAPDLRPEHQRVADARLEDEFLVQLTELGLAVGQVRAERAGVGDRAAVGQRQHPRAGERRQLVVHAVPVQAGAQFAVGLAWIAAREHFQRHLEGARAQVGVGVGAAHQVEERVHVPRLYRDHRHNLLRQHVQRMAGRARWFDRAAQHPARDGGGLDDVLAVGGEDAAHTRLPDEVPGAAHALQALRYRLGAL